MYYLYSLPWACLTHFKITNPIFLRYEISLGQNNLIFFCNIYKFFLYLFLLHSFMLDFPEQKYLVSPQNCTADIFMNLVTDSSLFYQGKTCFYFYILMYTCSMYQKKLKKLPLSLIKNTTKTTFLVKISLQKITIEIS